jgi:non-lysosomal glucosylceramidase
MSSWPILTRYEQDYLPRVALPLGGIGTGTVSLGGRGDLRDWEIVNRPAKGFTPQQTFFALRTHSDSRGVTTRALEGPIDVSAFEGPTGSTAPNHGLPRFRKCTFEAAYPLGRVLLSDPDTPVDACLEAFNPLIPADADRSGIPMALLRFVLTNKSDEPVNASVCGSLQNFVGTDGSNGMPNRNRNEFRQSDDFAGVFLRSDGVDPQAEQWGTIALATMQTADVTYRTAWADLSWGDALLDFWDDFTEDGRLSNRDIGGTNASRASLASGFENANSPTASLATGVDLPPGGTEAVTFILTWHFPNRRAWAHERRGEWGYTDERVGNYYTTQYRDAWDVVEQTASAMPVLEGETVEFVESFCASDLPDTVKEAALYNVSTLRTQTCFRTQDGYFYGWEGCSDQVGCCLGSCTHVWNYEQATAFLFGELSLSLRELEFQHATRDDGHMSFRIDLPLERVTDWGLAAADGQMGCIMKLYRDWQLSGDEEMLNALWPKARKALEFCWIPGGWDADRDGVMEGCQHNTMDIEYYGPNPQMGSWYLGALRAAEEMASYLGEEDFAETCRDLFERGSRWVDEQLFNGEYYEHEVRPPVDASTIASGLRHEAYGAKDLSDPELQLGAGCLVDQLVGQYMAHVCGLGYVLKQDHVRKALESVMKYNFKERIFGHFNHTRTFVLGDESALLMAAYPRGRRPKRPFPYFNEVMTGFEYTAAAHMLYEGQTANGLKCIGAIRDRFDGKKRSPFDEAECGHHYARAMASWAAVLALTGFRYSGVDHSIRFASANRPSQFFWSNGHAWGICKQTPTDEGIEVELTVLHGELRIKRLILEGTGTVEFNRAKTLARDATERIMVESQGVG